AYDQLGDDVRDGRMAGLIAWTSIEDRNRQLMGHRYFPSPGDAGRALTDLADPWQFRPDKGTRQPVRPEVWVEKAALEGVVGSIANKLEVDFFCLRGYNSASEQWRAGQRFAGYVRRGQRPVVVHLGDHDPSGIDMTRDNAERLELFT